MTDKRSLKARITFGIILLCSIFTTVVFYKTLKESSHQSTSIATPPTEQEAPEEEEEIEIAGWEAHVSRETRLYVPAGGSVRTAFRCPPRPLLLVAVLSAPENADRRDAIRDSWASLAGPETRVVFLIGLAADPGLQTRVDEESDAHGDVVQMSFVDSYDNLTIKSVTMLQWVDRRCRQTRFLMKADDDSYVDLPALASMLKPISQTAFLIGRLSRRSKPYRQTGWKWYCPRYIFSEDFYPDYLYGGGGYLMSIDVVHRLYKAALDTPLIHLEDIYITGICARAAGLVPVDHDGFMNWKTRRPTGFFASLFGAPPVVSWTGLSAAEMRAAAARVASGDSPVPAPTAPAPND